MGVSGIETAWTSYTELLPCRYYNNWLSIATSGRSDRSVFADASLFEENTDAQLFSSGIEVADGSA